MRDEILTYFERELTYLRQLGADYAERYPSIAGRLRLEPERCEDPHVERLIEAVAFLTARIRHKIDDDFSEITHSLLGLLYPHYLAPIPSLTTVQFHLDPSKGQLTTGHEIAGGTQLTAKPVRGVRCRFRTCFPVTLWPIKVESADLQSPLAEMPLPSARSFHSRSMVRIRLQAFAGTGLSDLKLRSLRFFLHGENVHTADLYEMLCAGPTQVELHRPGAPASEPGIVLADGSLQPGALGRGEMALPLPTRGFHAYGLLQEYFCFPSKFLYVDLHHLEGLAALGVTGEFEIRVFTARTPRTAVRVQGSTFRLGCVPVINLFERQAEPITVDHTKVEYRVVPDAHAPSAHEVYSVNSVMCVGDRRGPRPLPALYALHHDTDPEDTEEAFWHATRRQAIDGGTEIYLSVTDGHLSHRTPATEVLSVATTCTNRDLPSQLPFSGGIGADLDSEDLPPFVRVECLGRPSPPQRPDVVGGTQWRLVSHLALNYLSLVENGGTEALRGLLELYDVANSDVTRQQITGITNVRSVRAVRSIGGAFCRGLRVTLTFDREHFVGAGMFLFATVLERFLGLYAAINSFVQVEARVEGEEEPLNLWPPRAGEQIVL